MPWRGKTVEELRLEFVQAAQQSSNFSSLCREYGISRKTGYKWQERHKTGQPMTDQSRRPNTSPNRTPEAVEQLILAVRAENPGWGAKTIRQVLTNQGYTNLPCVKTVNNILHRYGCISVEESQKRQPYIRFQKENCNEMWQTDFKGEFLTKDEKYCYPLTILDDCSRFSIKISPCLNTANVVIPAFIEAFQEFGMPESVLSDNGSQFAALRRGYTQFEKMLMNLDILPVHGRVKHPQTQGKIERFHRTMKDELLKHTTFSNIEEANRKIQDWRNKYNNERPHEALGMKCPACVYVPSHRPYPGKIPEFEYSGEYHILKVNTWGYVKLAGRHVYLSETMIGEYIEFRPNPLGDSFFACYRNFKIAEFDALSGQLIHRFISRL